MSLYPEATVEPVVSPAVVQQTPSKVATAIRQGRAISSPVAPLITTITAAVTTKSPLVINKPAAVEITRLLPQPTTTTTLSISPSPATPSTIRSQAAFKQQPPDGTKKGSIDATRGTDEYPQLIVDFSGWRLIEENRQAASKILKALKMRERYLRCLQKAEAPDSLTDMPTPDQFLHDYDELISLCADGPVVTMAIKRLKVLEYQSAIHRLMNGLRELNSCKPLDNNTSVRVDTHIHLAAAMTQKHLLDFIKNKLKTAGNEVVMIKNGAPQTLKQVFASLNLDESRLSVDSLDVRASGTRSFQRFDIFTNFYNPFGVSDLRTIFLKTNNHIGGKYLAELTKELFEHVQSSSEKTEYRISIYGKSSTEWDELAAWVAKYQVRSACNRWLIQIPRLYSTYKQQGVVTNFSQMLDNIFLPLMQVTESPASHPLLEQLLQDVSGIDCVDDESRVDTRIEKEMPLPHKWDFPANPPYHYYLYHLYSRISQYNALRRSKNLSTLDFRPHAGESGSEKHLIAAFLTSTSINHGINLEKTPVLQYLYYLAKIGVCVSPLSNNSLFLDYSQNPFAKFFHRGLNVSLSTDDPLQFHLTQSPLTEEYAVASRFWKLTEVDLAEIAFNSVRHSGFTDYQKSQWLGPGWKLSGTLANDPSKSGVPMIRSLFRLHCHDQEMRLLHQMDDKNKQQQQQQTSLMVRVSVSPTPQGTNPTIAMPEQYQSTSIKGLLLSKTDASNSEALKALPELVKALNLRKKYEESSSLKHREEFRLPGRDVAILASQHGFATRKGVVLLYASKDVICANDDTELATVDCLQCGGSDAATARHLCAECDHAIHKSFSRCAHQRTEYKPAEPLFTPRVFSKYVEDYKQLCEICNEGPVRTLCWHRNHLMEERYNFHLLLNDKLEEESVKGSGTDFYRVTKVDTHVHANRSMVASQLLDFIKKKFHEERNTVVYEELKGVKQVTLGHLFEMLGLKEEDLTLNGLDVMADQDTFMRFDIWVGKYNPFGKPELRDLFLRTGNYINGRFLAELIRETTFGQLTLNPSLRSELRISVCGTTRSEIDEVATWVVAHQLQHPHNRWVIQIPRVWDQQSVHAKSDRRKGSLLNFGQLLDNIFHPLFEATRNPQTHQALHEFMLTVSGFDTIGNESALEKSLSEDLPDPLHWESAEVPPYAYWNYYLWANIQSLNYFRKLRSLNMFEFRPHAGESGDVFHLAAAFLTAKGINHGTQLKENPALQYLYNMAMIGVSSSPLSECTLHLQYQEDPFLEFFKRGLNITLSTDNALQLHRTKEPLAEEYASAAQMWKLSNTDLCEIARNSVIQSGFTREEKDNWIGHQMWRASLTSNVAVNDVTKTNLPKCRLRFRADTHEDEMAFLHQVDHSSKPQYPSVLGWN